jgi:hypothetical protein
VRETDRGIEGVRKTDRDGETENGVREKDIRERERESEKEREKWRWR